MLECSGHPCSQEVRRARVGGEAHWPLFGALFSQHPEGGADLYNPTRAPPPAQPSPPPRLGARILQENASIAWPSPLPSQGDERRGLDVDQSSWGHGLAAQALGFPGPPLRGLWEDDPAMECGRDTLVKGKHQAVPALPAPGEETHVGRALSSKMRVAWLQCGSLGMGTSGGSGAMLGPQDSPAPNLAGPESDLQPRVGQPRGGNVTGGTMC